MNETSSFTPRFLTAIPVVAQLKLLLDQHWESCGRPRKGFIFSNELGKPMNLEALAVDVIRPALQQANLAWHAGTHSGAGSRPICTDSEFPTRSFSKFCATQMSPRR